MSADKEQTTIRLPTKLLEQLKQEADKRGISLNAMLMIVIDKGFEFIRQK